MAALYEGTIDGWPVSILADKDLFHCAPYLGPNDEPVPDGIMDRCWKITDACEDMSTSKAIRKAKQLGFVEDYNASMD